MFISDITLSQNEIDMLIRNLGSAAPVLEEPRSEDRVEVYDFRRANRLTREQGRLLMRIYEQLGRSASTAISARLQRPVVIRCKSVQQLSYGEFVYSLPSATAVAIYHDKVSDQPVMVQISTELAMSMYDRLCGGSGAVGIGRELTEIECSVLASQIFDLIASALERAWAGLLNLDLEFKSVETSLVHLGIMPDRDVVVVGTFDVTMAGTNDLLTLCCPYTLMESVLGKSMRDLFYRQHGKQSQVDLSRLKRLVGEAQVEVEVMLGEAQVDMQQLLELQRGDVIVLDRRVDEPLEVRVSGVPKFRALPGVVGKRLAVVVTGIVAPEEV
ncbi:MAG: flagellar motor switch protein FliM [Bacillota bacterium]